MTQAVKLERGQRVRIIRNVGPVGKPSVLGKIGFVEVVNPMTGALCILIADDGAPEIRVWGTAGDVEAVGC